MRAAITQFLNWKGVSSRISVARPFILLLLVFFACRLLFQQLVFLKSAFIYPTGLVLEQYIGFGFYDGQQWLFRPGATRFLLGETCSGTTFFSLLVAYLVYRLHTRKKLLIWLSLAYPVALFANSMRVLSAIHAHQFLTFFDADHLAVELHVVTGSIAFLCCFLIVAWAIEKQGPGRADANT
ncbi:MAG: hypothetical protein GY815_11210 [Gammaproteobacteria bacterium]|nr:hypothetical protein [Gammaproteobacteria bacterium]